ncbi:MAG: hypothetical protein AAGF83_26845 [Cyanobacteria bacterium P01_G01_bin.67]
MQNKQLKNIPQLLSYSLTLFLVLGGLSHQKSAWAKNRTSTIITQNSVKIVARSAQQSTLYLNNDRTYSYNLIAQERGTINNVTIPQGATIVGKYVPAEGGLRYIAEAVTYDGYSYSINAASGIIKDVKDPRDTSAGAIATDAGIGAAGGTILGEVFGGAGVGEIVGGAAAGAAVGNLTADRVVVIEPDSVIALY